ncbi:hypothetical protein Egran_00367 [Elaphomyces granulatus]|uniref:Uncharacterized protein n=1 Tax=Elaphomyces granulatus TaxID=519963 RepID=A0A232M628_9EURO|nr:hypothetical protein Egran_00367 [Elaphomyces granulatus]
MAPAAQDDMGIEAHVPNLVNGQNSSFHRQFSEPLHVPSVRKSIWCGKYFQTPGIDETSHGDDFDQQVTPINPSIVKISMYDGEDDTDDDEGVNGDEEGDYVSDEDELEEADEQQGEDEGDEENEETEAGVEDAGEQEQIEYDIDFIAQHEGQDRNMTAEYGPDSIMEEELTVENGVDLFGEEDAESTAGEEAEFTAGDGMEGKLKELDDEFVDEPEANKLRGFSEEQEHASVEKRLASLWNIHKVINFSTDYDDGIADLDYSWDCTFRQSKRLKKRHSADIPNRPNPYERDTVLKGDFLQITPVERFLEQLRNPETKSYDELYSTTSNVAHALKVWQDEYLAIDHLSKMASRQAMKKTVNPRKAENRQVFEDKKEATLYGYKHDPRDSRVGIQDPFVQGGFKPTTTQLRKGKTNVSADNLNLDRWPPIFKFGMEYVPRFQDLPKIPGEVKQTRKRKAAQMEAANSANETNGVAESTPVVGTENDIEPPAKRQTRFSGGKRPSAQETPQAGTVPSNPPVRHRATTGHGRGTSARGSFGRESAGRGISNHKASAASKGPSRGASDRTASNRGGLAPGGGAPGRKASGHGTPNRSTPVRRTQLRGNPGRESSNRKPLVRSGQKHKASITPQSSQPSPVTPARTSARIPARKSQVNSVSPSSSLQARPAANKNVAAAPSTPNENPAPTTTISVSASDTTAANDSIPATSSPPATTPATSPNANGDDSVDSVELARREKIANSKNPKRTEAMLNHWEKFNREGRTRNPKRTRAQIEAARSVEAHKKATEPTKPSPKKRRNAEATTNDEPPTKSIKTESPMLAPIQPTLAPASAIPVAAPALAPAPPPPLAPLTLTPALPQYPPIEPRGVVPHYPPLAPNLSPMAPSFPTLAPNPPPLAPNPPTLAPNHPPLGPTPPPLGPAPSLSHLALSAPHPMAYPPHGYPTEYYVHYGAPPLILSPHHRGDHTNLI